MKKYYITGTSGAGKSTLSEEFKKRGLNAIDLDDGFCAWRNIKTSKEANTEDKANSDFYEKNDWYCDLDKFQEFINNQKDTLFVFGACANHDYFLPIFDKVFLLKCNPEVFLERLASRTNNNYGKMPSEKENELRWFHEYNNQMIKKGAIIIDAEKPLLQVMDEIISKSGI